MGIIAACVPLLGPLIYPSRYKTSGTSKYANLTDDSTKQNSTISSGKTRLLSKEDPSRPMGGVATDSLELSALPDTSPFHEAWVHSERLPSHTHNTGSGGNTIGVEREFEVTTKVKPADELRLR